MTNIYGLQRKRSIMAKMLRYELSKKKPIEAKIESLQRARKGLSENLMEKYREKDQKKKGKK